MSVTQQLLSYYQQAYEQATKPGANPTSIQQTLDYCTHALRQAGEGNQADITRLRIYATQSRLATDADIDQLWSERDSWGHWLTELATTIYGQSESWVAANSFACHPVIQYEVIWGLQFPVTTMTSLSACVAWRRIEERDFDQAKAILTGLSQEQQNHPLVQFMWAMLYYRSQRWPQAIESAGAFMDPPLLAINDSVYVNGEQGGPVQNVALAGASIVIRAYGHAHLDEQSVAEGVLNPLVNSSLDFPGLSAEACRIQGLIERRRGNEDKAQKIFGAGISLDPSSTELVTAQRNAKVGLTVTTEQLINQRTSYWDVGTETSLESAQAADASDNRAKLLAEAEAELNRQIGMEAVKEQARAVQRRIRYNSEATARGIELPATSNHMIFSGPPGTGKTTIARVLSKIFLGYGITRTDTIIEVGREDLVAGYQGQTATKTKEVFNRARGGILFIDEVYSLLNQEEGSARDNFGQEAINVILTETDNNRDDLIVIVAGYEHLLNRFFDANQGLRSRFAKKIQFSSYSPSELASIGRVHAELRGSWMSDEAVKAMEVAILENLSPYIDSNNLSMIDRAGNGRFARNVIENASEHRETRLMNTELSQLGDKEFTELTASDITQAVATISENVR